MNQAFFRKLISGEETGIGGTVLFWFLRQVSHLYGLVIRVRNVFYDRGWIKQFEAGARVISIGNITAGGTGKTPLVIWVCNYVCSQGRKCAVLTRGYKAGKGKFTDEPAILAKSCPKGDIVVNADRVAGAKKAVEKFGAEVLVMDDGFQHRRLWRDIDIVLIDAILPFGYGRVLPGGLLREPVGSLSRADAVVITRSDQVESEKLAEIEREIRRVNVRAEIFKSVHKPVRAVMIKGKVLELGELVGKKVYAFCGIGNPQGFYRTLEGLGVEVVGRREYNDHHSYSGEDITDIYEEARYVQADIILTTQKDWVKSVLLTGDEEIGFAYLDVMLEFLEKEDRMKRLVDKVIKSNES